MAARSLGVLTLDLVAKIGGFTAGMTEAERKADKTARNIAKGQAAAAKAVQDVWKSALAGFAGAFSVAGLVSVVNSTLDGVDALNDLADATGASVENLSALDDVARRTGSNLDEVGTILTKFNMVLKDADPDSGAAAVFAKLNLDINELKKLDPAEALRQTAVAFNQFADDGNKGRAMLEVFGKNAKQAAAFIKDLGEEQSLQATVTKEQADAAEFLNKRIFAVQAEVVKLARTIVADFAQPALTALAFVVDAVDGIARAFEAVGVWVGGAAAALSLLTRGEFSQAGTVVSELLTDLQELAMRPLAGEGIRQTVENLKALQTQADATRDSIGDITGKGTRSGRGGRAPIERRGNDGGIPLDRAEAFRLSELRETAEVNKALTDAQIRGFEETREAAQKYDEQLAKLNENLNEDLKENAENVGNIKSAAQELGMTFASAFEDAIVEGKKFSDVLKGLYQDILRIIIRRQVTEPLANFIGGLFSGARANGGSVAGGQTYLVGEQGPELFTPNSAGMITPNGALTAGGGGPVSVQIINQTSTPVTGTAERTDDGGLRVFIREVVNAVADDMRAGGSTASAVAQITGAGRQVARRGI